MHVQTKSTIPDHCQCFGLSDVESDFVEKCDHEHTDSCRQCVAAMNILDEIVLNVEKNEWENKDAITFVVSVCNILEMSLYGI